MSKVQLLELAADSYSETSVTSLKGLKGRDPGQLKVIRDNVQTHCGLSGKLELHIRPQGSSW